MTQLDFKIETSHSSNSEVSDFLTDKINAETTEYGIATSFAFWIRDHNHQIIAGCNGAIIYGKIYTDQLWVDLQYRKQGLGEKLMTQVHAYGKEQHCTMASVSTMSFQNAVGFYKKLGYEIDYERKGHTQGSSCFFMTKAL